MYTRILTAVVALAAAMATPAEATAPVLPRIAIDDGGLTDTATGRPFVPRGANYVRLAEFAPPGAAKYVYSSTFEPGRYDQAAVRAALAQMKHDGYNTVRVFIDHGGGWPVSHGISTGGDSVEPIKAEYLANVTDFVRLAADHGVYTLPSLDGVPPNRYYSDIIRQYPVHNVAGHNLHFLHTGFLRAKQEYLTQFSARLLERLGPRYGTAVLAYQADNEQHFRVREAPYHEYRGTVTGLDGVVYDMANPAERQRSADASLAVYVNGLKDALTSVDPAAELAIGFFTNRAVNRTGFDGLSHRHDWAPGRPSALGGTAVDLLDIHLYPKVRGYTVAEDLATMEHRALRKPVIAGEFGAHHREWDQDLIKAAWGMRDAQVASCAEGVRGWLFWTWDTREPLANQDEFFNLSDGGGAINGVWAPIKRPDACVR
ncbi:hypothetical protein [Amycolatopsis suaedae]|uniref:Glycoside hydrolase family 5 domain-containing protein n=1 Tax=Amycolatopsis suaedae TaxID=2510978 RepID=A0A4Q7J2V8_9PSEU|nr:hypothetical protein [Amycolatopsis suaedae]RZQ61267.1 hypothetical protein EWH70_25725 [Amycolatopsis suaedae]